MIPLEQIRAARERIGDAIVRTSLYWACESLRQLALLLAPFLPGTSREILTRLGVASAFESARIEHVRGPALAPGTPIAKGAPLFPRLAPPAATP